jgi:2-keto-myo-inositol isomerase
VCDVAGLPRELMADSDRVLPGEGDFHLGPVVRRLEEIGYAGAVSVEVMNPVLWKAKPTQVGELALAAVQRLLAG